MFVQYHVIFYMYGISCDDRAFLLGTNRLGSMPVLLILLCMQVCSTVIVMSHKLDQDMCSFEINTPLRNMQMPYNDFTGLWTLKILKNIKKNNFPAKTFL